MILVEFYSDDLENGRFNVKITHNEECILSNEVRERERKERGCGCFIDCVVEYQCSNRCSRCVSRDHQQQSKGECDILKSRLLLVPRYGDKHDEIISTVSLTFLKVWGLLKTRSTTIRHQVHISSDQLHKLHYQLTQQDQCKGSLSLCYSSISLQHLYSRRECQDSNHCIQ